MAKVTGLGGVFFVSKDVEASKAWYRDVLGIDGKYGPQMLWSEDTKDQPYSLIGPFTESNYFKPGNEQFMVNLRVDDLDEMVAELKAKGIDVLDSVDEGYGKFAWILDPDGIKIELWEQCAPPE